MLCQNDELNDSYSFPSNAFPYYLDKKTLHVCSTHSQVIVVIHYCDDILHEIVVLQKAGGYSTQ